MAGNCKCSLSRGGLLSFHNRKTHNCQTKRGLSSKWCGTGVSAGFLAGVQWPHCSRSTCNVFLGVAPAHCSWLHEVCWWGNASNYGQSTSKVSRLPGCQGYCQSCVSHVRFFFPLCKKTSGWSKIKNRCEDILLIHCCTNCAKCLNIRKGQAFRRWFNNRTNFHFQTLKPSSQTVIWQLRRWRANYFLFHVSRHHCHVRAKWMTKPKAWISKHLTQNPTCRSRNACDDPHWRTWGMFLKYRPLHLWGRRSTVESWLTLN